MPRDSDQCSRRGSWRKADSRNERISQRKFRNEWEGHELARAVSALRMHLRFSAWGVRLGLRVALLGRRLFQFRVQMHATARRHLQLPFPILEARFFHRDGVLAFVHLNI